MPERWLRDLKRLGDLGPSDGVWHRAEQGPRFAGGADLPPRRRRLVAGIVAAVVFLAAGGFAWRAFRPSSPHALGSDLSPSLVVNLRILDRGGVSVPTATLNADGRTILGATATTRLPAGRPDGAVPRFTDDAFVPVEIGSLLGAKGDAESVDAELESTQGNVAVVPFGQLSDAVVLDPPAGRYVLRLTGHWLQGNANFYFPIDLVEQAIASTPDPDPATLTFVGKNAPTATLVYGDAVGTLALGDASQDGVRTVYIWCGSGECVQGIADYATYPPAVDYLPVPIGTRIEMHGDATSITGVFTQSGKDHRDVDLNMNAVPSTPGRYVLQLDVEFDLGSATFFMGIEATGP